MSSKQANGHGLGLTSMKERLRLVSGALSIDSELGHGTTVLARVPLASFATKTGCSVSCRTKSLFVLKLLNSRASRIDGSVAFGDVRLVC